MSKIMVKMLSTTDDPDGPQRVMGKIFFDGETVTFEGFKSYAQNILFRNGIRGPKYGRKYTPADGMEFMEALKYEFSGSYLRCTAPVEVK